MVDSESESSLILSVSDTSYECESCSDGSDVERENRDCLPYQFERGQTRRETPTTPTQWTGGIEDVRGESVSWQHRMDNKNPYI